MREHAEPSRERTPLVTTSGDPTLLKSAGQSPAICTYFQKHDGFMEAVRTGYKDDPILAKVVETPKHHPMFSVDHGLIHARNSGREKVLCIPRTRWKGNMMTTHIIEHAHKVLGHLGALRTADYIHRWYWWPGLGKEVDQFYQLCPVCQTMKTSNKKLAGLLHSLPIPRWPWNSITMDFIGPFPESNEDDYLWVVLCQLTSMVHLVPVKTTIRALQLAWLFIKEIVCLHGLPETIVSDRNTKFTSQFWGEMHRLLGV